MLHTFCRGSICVPKKPMTLQIFFFLLSMLWQAVHIVALAVKKSSFVEDRMYVV
jgi:hypothetical protein